MVGNLIFYGIVSMAIMLPLPYFSSTQVVSVLKAQEIIGFLSFYPFRIHTVWHGFFVTMYNYHPPCVWLNLTCQNRIVPTVSMLSVTGRPHGCAGYGGSLWGSRRARGRQCAEQYRLLSYLYFLPNLLKDHNAIVCKLWGFMRIPAEEEICRETASSKTPTDVFAPKSTRDAQNFACFVKERSTQ